MAQAATTKLKMFRMGLVGPGSRWFCINLATAF
jgi:hypothetical protein